MALQWQHPGTRVGFKDKNPSDPREVVPRLRGLHSSQRLLPSTFMSCLVTNALLNSDGVNDVGLPQEYSLLC